MSLLSWLPILGIALLLRATLRAPADEPWSTRADAPLALASGVAAALIGGLWLARFELVNEPLTASDFGQYCVGVDVLRGGGTDWPAQRSVAAGWLAGMLGGRLGIVDALVVSAFSWFAVTGAAVYVWGRAIGGRLGAVCAALSLCAVGPIVVLTRTVTYYPATIAAFVLAAAGTAAAIRWRTAPALLFAGIGAGAALLADVRGLLWGLPTIAVGVAVAAMGAPGPQSGISRGPPALLLALALPVGVAWLLGPWAFPPGAISLEQQVTNWAADAVRAAGAVSTVTAPAGGFVWGASDPLDLPRTLAWLATISDRLPPEVQADPLLAQLRGLLARQWLAPALCALAVVLATAARRRPVVALALAASAVPFVVALHGAITVLGHPRYVATGLLVVPVLLGLAWEGLATRRPPRDEAPVAPRSEALRLGAGVAAFVLLLLGVAPSWLSPVAPWRTRTPADSEPAATLSVLAGADPTRITDHQCLDALHRDVAAGRGPSLLVDETPTRGTSGPAGAATH